MNVGMLWFDNDSKAELNAKIERAATYYRNKYGKNPTLCFVHPSMIPAAEVENRQAPDPGQEAQYRSGEIEVRSTRSILPNHFWIGINTIQ
jgi:hypothetical protein